jgi:hypothetical protein
VGFGPGVGSHFYVVGPTLERHFYVAVCHIKLYLQMVNKGIQKATIQRDWVDRLQCRSVLCRIARGSGVGIVVVFPWVHLFCRVQGMMRLEWGVAPTARRCW